MHIPVKPLSKYPLWLRPLYYLQRRRYGAILEPGLLWGRVPKLFAAVAGFYAVIDRKRSPLDPVLRSLIIVRVSQINWCHFCVDINSATLAQRTGSMDKVLELERWSDSTVYDDRERVALEYAEAVTYTDQQVSKSLMARLKQHLDDDAVIELTGLIAFQNLSSKFNAALDVPAQGFCQRPD